MIPDVKNAAVIVSEYAGDKKLGAYVVTDCLTEVEIREELKKKLPSYMLPNFEITRPVTNIEKEVASLYESILGIQNISIDDSFIDIGGHSIKAMQVVNAIASIFSVQIQVVEIMRGGSVQEVAKFIEQNKDQVIGDTLDLEVEEE